MDERGVGERIAGRIERADERCAGEMHAARLAHSPRLQRVHAVLSDGLERSTLDIANAAQVCAVNSCIAELRANGATIPCRQIRNPATGTRIWLYKMMQPCPQAEGGAA